MRALEKTNDDGKGTCVCVPNCNRHRSVQHLLTVSHQKFKSIKCVRQSGEFPQDFSLQPDLEVFEMLDSYFKVYGEIPESIGYLSKLKVLTLGNAPKLSGPLPANFSRLLAIEEITITGARITGGLEPAFSNVLPNLKSVKIADTGLTGNFSARAMACLSNANVLDLSRNSLKGDLPNATNTSFTSFDVSSNVDITGHPPNFLWDLDWFDISGTSMCGDLPPSSHRYSPSELPQCPIPSPTTPAPSQSFSFTPTRSPTLSPSTNTLPSRNPTMPPPTMSPTHQHPNTLAPTTNSITLLNGPAARGSLISVAALLAIGRLAVVAR